jgi:hypothetical protein
METARPAREDDLPACLELLTLALANARSVGTGTLEELLGPIEDGAAIAM